MGAIVGLIVLVGGITLYRTFALYEEKKEFNVLKGRVPDFVSGDVTIAAIIDGESSSTIPKKEDSYVFESVTCTNGAEAEWDSSEWSIKIKNLTKSRTTCTVSFKTMTKIPPTGNFSEYITKLADSSEDLAYDGTADNNLRYIGANPNNYVTFNNELWRIIGVMNNIKDSNGNTGTHIKIIRNESIGNYSWDNKPSGTGSSTSEYGSNDWSDSALMEVLNNGAYWNRTSGKCPFYFTLASTTIDCDFSNTGLTDASKNMIAKVKWKIGGSSIYNNVTASIFYERERGTEVYSGHATEWTGRIGLIYPSDYGYATSGGSTTDRTTCLNTYLYSWDGSNVSDCKNNDWLYLSKNGQWTFTSYSNYSDESFQLDGNGIVVRFRIANRSNSYPTLYLNSNIEIISGEGTQENPYQIKLGS